MAKAGDPVSIRLPKGTAEQIRAAYGQPVGKLLRDYALVLVERAKQERLRAEAEQQARAEQAADQVGADQ